MARSDTRYSVYPTPRAIDVVGNSAPALNQAIECWSALLARATADNSNNISPWYRGMDTPDPYDQHFLYEWCVLAEALQGKRFDPDFANPGDLLAAAVEDAHRLESVGDRWFASQFDGEMYAKGLSSSVTDLVEKLHRLDYVHAWAVIVAIQWFWEHLDEGVDIKKDPWWTLAFRRQWKEKLASKQGSDGRGGRQQGKEAHKKKSQVPSKGKARTEEG